MRTVAHARGAGQPDVQAAASRRFHVRLTGAARVR